MDTTPDTVTILYVDDEVQACKWFARTIGVGYEVLTANSVEEAKTVLRDSHERISVVLTDFRMPGANGAYFGARDQRFRGNVITCFGGKLIAGFGGT